MNPRQARRERREADRKAKKLELKKTRLSGDLPLNTLPPVSWVAENDPRIQPRWNPELEDEFPRELQIRNNAIADRNSLQAGLPIPSPGPSRTSVDYIDRMKAMNFAIAEPKPATGSVSQNQPVGGTEGESAPSSSRHTANRANAQFSTGPRTPEGKSASSRNSTKHGLTSHQTITPGEDPAAFEALLADLLAEHQPATETETLLVQQMAQSHWLAQRAIRLQNQCFTNEGVDEKRLALFLRYGSTHNRAFYKALADLKRLQKERRKSETAQPDPRVGFVSHSAAQATREPGFVPQNTAHPPVTTGFVPQTPTQTVGPNAA